MIFEPTAICDGRTIWYYRYDAQVVRPDQPYVSKGRLHMTQTLTGSLDDPMMPWPHLLPEQQSHPAVYVPTQDREFIVDASPTDGPPARSGSGSAKRRPRTPIGRTSTGSGSTR